MTKYVALLRGIGPSNPNMRNDKLRKLFESLGFYSVRSVISSGNILFETDERDTTKLEDMVETALPKKLGFKSTTIIRSQAQIQELIDKNPFKGIDDAPKSRLSVTFLKSKARPSIKLPYISKDKSYRVLASFNKAIFTTIDLSGTKTPDVMLWLERQFGKEITTRTWKTIHRIMNKLRS